MAIRLLVIHNISLPPGQFGGSHVDELFTNCLDPHGHTFFETIAKLRVSSHLFINRQGIITQYVSLAERAWHAGRSSFQGKENCNDYSIGIELEGTDDQPYTDVQYRHLAIVTRLLMREYPGIKTDNIVGHCDIAPGRKTDPGASFDWKYYRYLITNSA
jgi:AmpD protein